MPSILSAARTRFRSMFNSTRAERASSRFTCSLLADVVADQGRDTATRPWTTHDANVALYRCLSTSTPHRPTLPDEIILQILDHPSRWIQVHSVELRAVASHEPLRCRSNGPQHGDWQILVTDPVSGRAIKKLRKVVYFFRGQDQGWSSYPQHHGTYIDSWTWFEAGLARFEDRNAQGEELRQQKALRAEKERDRYELHRNRHAGLNPENYVIELGTKHDLLKHVEDGDRFALWARAVFPGWENRVHKARIEIYCVDDLSNA